MTQSRGHWSPSELLREAFRNLGARHAVWMLILTLVSAATATHLGHTALQALDAERRMRHNGSLVWVAEGSEEVSLSGRQCDDLRRYSGVAASGGVLEGPGPELSPVQPNGFPVAVQYVTAGAVAVFDDQAAPGVISAGDDLVRTRQVGLGTALRDPAATIVVTVDQVLRSGIPVPEIGSAITIPVRSDAALRTCWVRMEPGVVASASELLRFHYPQQDVRIGPLVTAVSTGATPADMWDGAASLHAWWLSGALAGAVGALLSWTRRSELAIYRTIGTSIWHLLFMLFLEFLLVALPATLAAFLASTTVLNLVASAVNAPVLALISRHLVSSAILAIPVAVFGSALSLTGRVTSQLKDR